MKRFIIIVLLVFVCVDGLSQQSVFVSDNSFHIYSLDLNNCASHFIGTITQEFNDIAFTPDGQLWGISSHGLFKIDTTNGAATFIGSNDITEGALSLVALNDSILLTEYNDSLYGINLTNLHSYNIGQIGYYADGDLSWYGNDLYMTGFDNESDGLIIKITFNSTFSAILSSTAVNGTNNLTPQFLGLATVSINGSDSLIGFADTSAYIISPIDGTYRLLCSSFETSYIFGAGSISFPLSLPVTLLYFKSTIINNTVKLQWQTATEVNSNYFSIEKSADGMHFSAIGKVPAAGNSSSLKQYSFVDNAPLSKGEGAGGEVYYRLNEVDLDGHAEYSNILLVKMPLAQTTITIAPNPASDRIFINASQPVQKIAIINPEGVVVMTVNNINSSAPVHISALASGIYFIKAYTQNGVMVSEFMKQ